MCFWNVAVGINLRKRTEKTEYLPWIGCPWWGWKRRVKKLPWNSTLKTKIMASSPSVKSESVSCSVTSDSLDCGSPGSSVHGILQARILEWVAILFSRESFQPRDRTWVSCIASRFFTVWAAREALCHYTFVKTSRMYNTNSGPWCKPWTSVSNSMSLLVLSCNVSAWC